MIDGSNQLENAINRVVTELREGLKHRFFEYRLVKEMVNGRNRQLVLEAGKSTSSPYQRRTWNSATPEDDGNSCDGRADGDRYPYLVIAGIPRRRTKVTV
jgi:hypothetical protein